ncbi:pyridoxamine 5'-phosphate oxidase [Snodgrassella communis]|uniref:pyridoxamine 5'-phosphate oxidase n=1 Tax=Snodgrassella communis TaxID=2946699 RepID=UPI001EF6E5F3|nr:pyridoxamine 5'-phosphate oxidase [Snodgrassella communis]
MDLHNIRQDYSKQSLNEADCSADPLEQFQKWLTAAMQAKVNEPTAMNIATVDQRGRPNARFVLLKEVTAQGFVFFTNYLSRKGRALSQNHYAALTFFWPELERQVRVEGIVQPLPAADSDAYFQSRPYSSRIGAWASEQSAVISSKTELMARAAKLSAKYLLNVPRPPHWGGYIVQPEQVEFWQGRPSRLHDRIQYIQQNNSWIKQRLSP